MAVVETVGLIFHQALPVMPRPDRSVVRLKNGDHHTPHVFLRPVESKLKPTAIPRRGAVR
jgi:hypothetical protein